ncbi:MAG: DUF2382 domain-containing protein [Oscillatoria sp. PMC 1068.18]|nr:DUF2382 domain-containing protein [Oscillatoria sp. PMC 1076.18]MEC4987981.1 DUF2382 domain-containing protein [Oscillatoria sp. PMC 1068.18]
MNHQNLADQQQAAILLEKLRKELRGFLVQTEEGKLIGTVRDLQRENNGQLNLVLSSPEGNGNNNQFLLNGKLIEKVDRTQGILLSKPVAENQKLISDSTTYTSAPESGEIQAEEVIRLLEEKLVVERTKHKVGEVIVRKEIETRMVEVPVYREKLIVEQVGAENKQLAEIDLGEGKVTGVAGVEVGKATVRGEFISPRAASDLLAAIALEQNHGCAEVRVEIVLNNPELKPTYQQMFDRCTGK